MTEPTAYDIEQARQAAREDIPANHLGVHRWFLRMENPCDRVENIPAPDGVTQLRAINPTIDFYRFLYHTAGEQYLWAFRREMSDAELAALVTPATIHVVVVYLNGVPAGFFELDFAKADVTNLKYFALLPGFTGRGLGRYMLNACIAYAAERNSAPLTLDTCTLDHPVALLNYQARGFEIYDSEDEVYPDPRLDGTVPYDAGQHLPPPKPNNG